MLSDNLWFHVCFFICVVHLGAAIEYQASQETKLPHWNNSLLVLISRIHPPYPAGLYVHKYTTHTTNILWNLYLTVDYWTCLY